MLPCLHFKQFRQFHFTESSTSLAVDMSHHSQAAPPAPADTRAWLGVAAGPALSVSRSWHLLHRACFLLLTGCLFLEPADTVGFQSHRCPCIQKFSSMSSAPAFRRRDSASLRVDSMSLSVAPRARALAKKSSPSSRRSS